MYYKLQVLKENDALAPMMEPNEYMLIIGFVSCCAGGVLVLFFVEMIIFSASIVLCVHKGINTLGYSNLGLGHRISAILDVLIFGTYITAVLACKQHGEDHGNVGHIHGTYAQNELQCTNTSEARHVVFDPELPEESNADDERQPGDDKSPQCHYYLPSKTTTTALSHESGLYFFNDMFDRGTSSTPRSSTTSTPLHGDKCTITTKAEVHAPQSSACHISREMELEL